ncbi:calcium permeable stress-gated cation channel 1 [Colletotrichum spaethianum]|uniref:Calcium permeable stress-gated cation channel 1 n=1 Tax=Colletotrichum spaethianum TaxID=700344 RepID=A0AA37L6N5_9PEZI|nr:calcium permeable stress-gated cation channel 1 [Colletotrichum spaethianum]GKT40593.1 calcium permeable stress-gated cation channel 1 [Colletotrichum spaethianum]
MDALIFEPNPDVCKGENAIKPTTSRDVWVQLGLSLLIGISAFIAFCILRPRWPTLYAARKRRLDPSIGLPALPNTFFGWIPALCRVTEEQVLASAGLDAFVFLSFFKMAIRILAILAFFAYAVLLPINLKFGGKKRKNKTEDGDKSFDSENGYLWAYLVFLYFFSVVTLYIMNKATFRVIHVRQEYLGTQSTITDRTFRLTGIPQNLRSEDKIKRLIEKLEIGQVENVSLCRNWKELDSLVAQREQVLAKLEETWSVYLGKQAALPKSVQRLRDPLAEPSVLEPREAEVDEEAGENGRLLDHNHIHPEFVERSRPRVRLWYGFLKLRNRKTDAIDYYEEKLRRLDEKIREARDKDFAPTDLAFVTMDSIAACQMAIQARIDPRPGQLLTKPAPSPSDVMWANTYAPRGVRRLRSWSVTIFVAVLTIVWLAVVASIATLLSICNFRTWFPSVVAFLDEWPTLRALIETGLPTLLVSLLNVAVPYLYEFLSYEQGMISKGDVELSIVSKNFFFTFFNIFIVLATSNTAFTVRNLLKQIQDVWKSPATLTNTIAGQLRDLAVFYTNFIMLQGIGLFPFRLLQVGSIVLYPIYRMGAKTPRDFAEIMKPTVFSYGFYLPTAMLIFILCLVYSTLEYGSWILTVGLVYFILGYFTYKYQLLYAMDQPQHATGGAWRIISYRVILGLFVTQVVMSSIMALELGFVQSVTVLPLIAFTVWYSVYFKRRFDPLTRYISLRSIRAVNDPDDAAVLDEDFEGPRPSQGLLRRGSTIDEDKEKGMTFVNPSLTSRLEEPWVYQDPPSYQEDGENGEGSGPDTETPNAPANTASAASDSSMSLGDTHIWRQQADSNNRQSV